MFALAAVHRLFGVSIKTAVYHRHLGGFSIDFKADNAFTEKDGKLFSKEELWVFRPGISFPFALRASGVFLWRISLGHRERIPPDQGADRSMWNKEIRGKFFCEKGLIYLGNRRSHREAPGLRSRVAHCPGLRNQDVRPALVCDYEGI